MSDFANNQLVEIQRNGDVVIRSSTGHTRTRCREEDLADRHRELLDDVERLRQQFAGVRPVK